MESMKIKIKITGPKVHDVGYRYFLMSTAIDMGLRGFQARNRAGEKEQEVIALVDGDEEAITDFKAMVGAQKPEHAEISNITCVDYEGDVMRTGEYAQVCSAQQLNKAIPLLLDIRDDLKEMKGDVKEMKGDIKAVRKTGDETLNEIKAVRKNTDTIPQIHEEIKGLREDIQPGYATHFRQVQSDVKAIKERLGMQ
jgi:acylphosphatase/gas vesicle protein